MLPCCAGQGQDAAGNAAAGPAPAAAAAAEQQLTTQAAAHAAAGAAALLLELAKLQKLTALTLVQVSHHFFLLGKGEHVLSGRSRQQPGQTCYCHFPQSFKALEDQVSHHAGHIGWVTSICACMLRPCARMHVSTHLYELSLTVMLGLVLETVRLINVRVTHLAMK